MYSFIYDVSEWATQKCKALAKTKAARNQCYKHITAKSVFALDTLCTDELKT